MLFRSSYLHRYAYPKWYEEHEKRGKRLLSASDKSGGEAQCLQLRGEYLYVAEGSKGMRVYDVASIGNKGVSQKIIKIDGYKGMLQKSVDETSKQTDYTLQVPIGSTLLTFTAPNTSEEEVIKMANTIPLSQITKMVQ